MKRVLFTFLAFVLCFTFVVSAHGGSLKTTAVSSNIAMITTNPAEDCSTAMNVGFHTPLGFTACYVQYTTADDTEWKNAINQGGSYKEYGADASVNPFYGKLSRNNLGQDYTQEHTFLDYNVTLTGLKPDTEYMYRICDGSAYSDVYRFKTAANDGSEWSFVVTGDFHEYYENYSTHRAQNATTAINAGIDLAEQLGWPEVEHIVSVGDIVAWGVAYTQWQSVLNQPYMKNYSFAQCIGNHDDMDRASKSSSAYNSVIFNNPTNGWNSGDEIGTVYYYVYNNVLFIVVNYLKASDPGQEAWAQSVIDKMAGKYQYSVLVNHRPATSKYNGKSYSYFWNYWADFCDKNKIDLVLAGDHHCYMRSQPINNGAMVSDYGPNNPDATVYLAGDSSDGERGSSTDVKPFDVSWVASNYYRYNFSKSTRDITTMIIRVGKDKLTTEFVYYENSSSATHPTWKEGTVTGHSSFYYGDTSYVYPSDHKASDVPPEVEIPVTNYLAKENGGEYMYPTYNYPGTATYYTYSYYGDQQTQGGEWISGKLNDGVIPAATTPGSSNSNWAVFFGSTKRNPEVTLKLAEEVYLDEITVVSITTGSYGGIELTELSLGTEEGSYTPTSDYTASVESSKLTVTFNSDVKAKYIQMKFKNYAGTSPDPSRFAIGEIEVWGSKTIACEEHQFGSGWEKNDTQHWRQCTVCGAKGELADHEYDNDKDTECNVCGYVRTASHSFKDTWTSDGTQHWHECSSCGEKTDIAEHSYDNDCDANCNVCGVLRTAPHNYGEDWKSDDKQHWHECDVCGEKTDVEGHVYTDDRDADCNTCGAVREVPPALQPGDVNGDEVIDNADAAEILRYDAHLAELTDDQFAAADVNGDEVVDSADAALILRLDAKLIPEFPTVDGK